MKEILHTLKAKFWRACATPGLFSNLLPPLTRKVTEDVASPLSTAATLTPEDSTTVANDLTALRAADVLAASIIVEEDVG